ncbi:MAG: hypothetical protein WBA30_14940 [Priestia megaterium]
MPISTWLYNNKVTFSVVPYENKQYLVCTSDVVSHTVHFVEDLETGKRVLNTNHPTINSGKDMDDLVKELIKSL